MSLVVSDIGAKDMIGLAGDAYRYGVVMMNFDFVACTFPVLIAAFLFMPLFWGSGVSTIPEYLGRRYNVAVRTFFAVIWSLFMIGTVATILRQRGVDVRGTARMVVLVLGGPDGRVRRHLHDIGWSQGGRVHRRAVVHRAHRGLGPALLHRSSRGRRRRDVDREGLGAAVGARALRAAAVGKPLDVPVAGARARPRSGPRSGLLGRQPGDRAAIVRREERSRRARVVRVRRGDQAGVPGAARPARSSGDCAVCR